MDKDKKKGLAALIIDASPIGKEKKAEDLDAEMSDKDMAAEELLSAISSKDPMALSEALTSFIKLCQYDDEAEVETPDSDEDSEEVTLED